jgi:hypothetical protein
VVYVLDAIVNVAFRFWARGVQDSMLKQLAWCQDQTRSHGTRNHIADSLHIIGAPKSETSIWKLLERGSTERSLVVHGDYWRASWLLSYFQIK